MSYFESNSSYAKRLLISLGLIILLYGILIPIAHWIDHDSFSKGYIAISLFALMNLWQQAQQKRLIHLHFDTDRKIIQFSYRQLFSGTSTQTIPFEEAKLLVYGARRSREHLPAVIHILKGKRESFILSRYKDGLSRVQLGKIWHTAEAAGIPVRV